MSIEHLILVAVVLTSIQGEYRAGPHDDRSLTIAIEQMNRKTTRATATLAYGFLQLDSIGSRFAPEKWTRSDERARLSTLSSRAVNRTLGHYADVEARARADRVLEYTSPTLFAIGLVREGRDDVVEPMRRTILASERVADDATRRRCVELLTAALDAYLERFEQLSAIEEAHPAQFSVVEETNGWDSLHAPMRPGTPPDVLRVHAEIVAVVERSAERLEEMRPELTRIGHALRPDD